MESTIKQALIDIVGEKHFADRLIDIISFSYDASGLHARPECALWPQNTGQVAAVLKFANKHRIPVTPRGAGTSVTGSSVPRRGGIVMDMSRMNRILKVSIEDRLAVVQPGVVFDHLNSMLSPYGFFYPPHPASGMVATIGGNVGTGAGGVKGAKYGTTRDYVLDLEVVLPDGSILRTGAPTMKFDSGYDLTRLFVGSEGTLGVITEITLKINPKPRSISTCTALFDDLPRAGKAVSEIMRSGIVPSVLELMDRPSLEAVNKATDLNLSQVEAMLLAETDGYLQQEADAQMDKVIEAFRNNGGFGITRAYSTEEADKLWAARKAIYAELTRLNCSVISEDLVVPISKVSDMLEIIPEIGRRNNILITTVAHAGDGNLHPLMVYDGTDPAEVSRVKKVTSELYRSTLDMGGTITGEHGVGISKADYMTIEHKKGFMDVMNKLKYLFDPNAILNPGKMGLDV